MAKCQTRVHSLVIERFLHAPLSPLPSIYTYHAQCHLLVLLSFRYLLRCPPTAHNRPILCTHSFISYLFSFLFVFFLRFTSTFQLYFSSSFPFSTYPFSLIFLGLNLDLSWRWRVSSEIVFKVVWKLSKYKSCYIFKAMS